MKLRTFVILGLLFIGLIGALTAQYPWAFSNPPRLLWQSAPAYVPATTANIATATSYVDLVVLANKADEAVTVTMSDRTTACGGAACPLLAAVEIAAHTTYVIEMRGGYLCQSGISWSASAGSSVVGYVRGVR